MATVTKKEKKSRPKAYVPVSRQETTRKIVLPGPDDLNIPSNDLHDYTILLMGAKAIGKTTASSTFPSNLNFQWEPMRRNIKLRMIGAHEGLILKSAEEIMDGKEDPWPLFLQYLNKAVDDPTVETCTWDTVDIAYSACFESVCARLGVKHPTEITDDYGNSWKMIQREFTAVLNTLKGMSMGTLLISHTRERDVEITQGKEAGNELPLITASCAPACIGILKSVCDFWFYYGWHEGCRRIWIRDNGGFVDVACGTGFVTQDGVPLNYIDIPENGNVYEHLSHAFKTGTPLKPGRTKIKVTKKKGAKRKH